MTRFAFTLGPAQVVFDLELMLLLTGSFLLIALGWIVVLETRKWMSKTEDADEPSQNLEHYQKLRDEGLLDPVEFERIRALLASKHGKPPTAP